MLMALGLNSKRDVYEEDFEKPFLQMSREFYKVQHFIRTHLFYYLLGRESTIIVRKQCSSLFKESRGKTNRGSRKSTTLS